MVTMSFTEDELEILKSGLTLIIEVGPIMLQLYGQDTDEEATADLKRRLDLA